LEAEVLESEDLQLEILRTIAKGKRLQKCLQVMEFSPSVAPQAKDKEAQPPSRDTSEPPSTLETNPEETVPPPVDSTIQTDETETATSGPPLTSLPPTLHATYASHTTMRLPRLDLSTFSGNTLDWRPFWDGFNAVVNSNPTLTGVQKLNYLRS